MAQDESRPYPELTIAQSSHIFRGAVCTNEIIQCPRQQERACWRSARRGSSQSLVIEVCFESARSLSIALGDWKDTIIGMLPSHLSVIDADKEAILCCLLSYLSHLAS